MALSKLAEPTEGVTVTAVDTVFEALLKNIVSGVYPSGMRLPAERDLARQLEASRPTLREALHRLGEWKLVESRRGSGVVVRPYRDWSLDALPAYLRYGMPKPGQPGLVRMLFDVLAMRRAIALEVVGLVAARIPKGGTGPARAAMARAWSVRNEPGCAREGFEVMRRLAEAAQLTPGLWLLNRLAEVWFDATDTLRFAIRPPDDYVATHTKLFDLIESGNACAACALLRDYLERFDAALLGAFDPACAAGAA